MLFGTRRRRRSASALKPEWLAFPVSLAIALAVGAAVGAINAFFVVTSRDQRLHRHARLLHLGARPGRRPLRRALGLGPARSAARHRDRAAPRRPAARLGLDPRLPGLRFHPEPDAVRASPLLIGGNATAAFRAGIRVDRLIAITFILAGAIAGLAGWLLAIRTAGATANLGIGMLFQAFAAVVIGGVSLKGGIGRLSGVFAGVLLLSSIQTAINVMGMPPHYTQMIQGALVLAAVLLDTLKTSIRQKLA